MGSLSGMIDCHAIRGPLQRVPPTFNSVAVFAETSCSSLSASTLSQLSAKGRADSLLSEPPNKEGADSVELPRDRVPAVGRNARAYYPLGRQRLWLAELANSERSHF